MKISDFDNEYSTPLLAKILQEKQTYLPMSDFNINILTQTNTPTSQNSAVFFL